jgi:urease accessory protein
MLRINRLAISLVTLYLLPALANAHPGDVSMHFADGFLHPLTGLDHLLAMVATGLWAVHLRGRATWMIPTAFPLAMIGGAMLATVGIGLPAIEPMIAVSVITLGCVIALRARVPAAMGVTLVGSFAIFHGYAHATEAASGVGVPFAIGFVSATIALHLFGMALSARMLNRDARRTSIAGAVIGATGVILLLGA